MNLEPFKPPKLDPFEKSMLNALGVDLVMFFSMWFYNFPTQPLAESMHDLFIVGLGVLNAAAIFFVAHCDDPPWDGD